MVDSSEIDLACDPKLSAKEVIEILQQNHALPVGRHYDADWEDFGFQPSDYYRSLALRINKYLQIPPRSLFDPLSDICRQLRGKILRWFCNSSRDRSLFWIIDSFLVRSELSVAQVFSGIFDKLNRLGANSWVGTTSPPQESIIDVTYQLARQYPPYRDLLIRELVDDPTILKKDPCILFKRLIVEPWDILATSHPPYLQLPPLIILEFVWDTAYTRDPNIAVLIELIQEYSSDRKLTPLLWLICTHPNDHQMRQPLLTIDAQPVYEHEVWTYDSPEAKQDVNDILHRGFQDVCQNHPVVFVEDEKWPLDAQLDRLASVICGVSHFACSVVHFVSGKGKDPKKQLETYIEFMAGCPPPSALHPFSGLFHFYREMVSNLPPDALDILRLSGYDFTTCDLANLLRIDRIKLYDLISDNLDHIVTLCPHENSEYGHTLEFRDGAFKHFLLTRNSPGNASDRDTLWVQIGLRLSCYGTFAAIVDEMTWKPSQPMDLWGQVRELQWEVTWRLWDAASSLGDGGYDQMRKFDFRNLVPISAKIDGNYFYPFLLRLKERQPEDEVPLVRTMPMFPSDHQLTEKCETVAIPMRFDDGSGSPGTDFPQYALVGYGIQTVLVILLWDGEGSPTVNIYSLDMLDDL